MHGPPLSSKNCAIGGYVDIHAHLLPSIDDGPPDLGESLAMARAAVDCGIVAIATTPHLRADFPEIDVKDLGIEVHQLRDALEREGIPLQVVPAAEVSMQWAPKASPKQLALASYGHHRTDVLIETPFQHAGGLSQLVARLQGEGYRVTLAHPERCAQYQVDDAPLRALVEEGALLQLNAGSLLGPSGRGRHVKNLAMTLLWDGLAHVIASDGHRARSWRPVTVLADAIEAAAELVGRDRAQWMAEAAPAAIIAGEPLPMPPPIQQRQLRRRFGLR